MCSKCVAFEGCILRHVRMASPCSHSWDLVIQRKVGCSSAFSKGNVRISPSNAQSKHVATWSSTLVSPGAEIHRKGNCRSLGLKQEILVEFHITLSWRRPFFKRRAPSSFLILSHALSLHKEMYLIIGPRGEFGLNFESRL